MATDVTSHVVYGTVSKLQLYIHAHVLYSRGYVHGRPFPASAYTVNNELICAHAPGPQMIHDVELMLNVLQQSDAHRRIPYCVPFLSPLGTIILRIGTQDL